MTKVSTAVTLPPTSQGTTLSARWRRLPLLAQMGVVALGVHLVVFTIFSLGGYLPHDKTPEELYEKAAAAMTEGKYAEARDLFQKVLDQQPKPPPIFARAAEQHRNAERLAAQAETAVPPTPPPPVPIAETATKRIERPTETGTVKEVKPAGPTKPTLKPGTPASPDQLIPPELR